MLLQLAYCSKRCFPVGESDPELADILATASRRNASDHITGCLGYGKSWFFQVLEGEESRVRQTLSRIGRDPRHSDIRLMAERSVRARSFPEWSMASVDMTASSSPYLSDIVRSGRLNPEQMAPEQILLVLMDLADELRLRRSTPLR